MNPAELNPGDRITTSIGAFVVLDKPWADIDDSEPQLNRVYVDVEPEDKSTRWDPNDLPAAAGAETFQWLGSVPVLRYRLAYLPDAEVTVDGARPAEETLAALCAGPLGIPPTSVEGVAALLKVASDEQRAVLFGRLQQYVGRSRVNDIWYPAVELADQAGGPEGTQ